MIVVVAQLRARAGREQDLGRTLKELIAPTRQEAGCVQYELHQGTEDPGQYLFYERWTDRNALDAHLSSKHATEIFARLPELTEGGTAIGTYILVE